MDDSPDSGAVRRQLDTDAENAGVEVVKAVADIGETDPTELATMHDCIDGVLDHLFSTPPSPEAEMQVRFTYESYRITVEQDGRAAFATADAE